jgi:hypothetical protein
MQLYLNAKQAIVLEIRRIYSKYTQTQSRHGCLCVRLFYVCVVPCVGRGLETGWSLAQGVYILCKKDYETEDEATAQHRTVEPLMDGWMNEWMKYTRI